MPMEVQNYLWKHDMEKSDKKRAYDKEWSRQYYLKNKEKVNKRNREYRDNNLTVNANNLLKKRYGITYEQYQEMCRDQDDRCKICGIPSQDLSVRLHIDHCHTTGKIRGLLCQNCNRGLGMFKDNQELLLKAKGYLDDNTSRCKGA